MKPPAVSAQDTRRVALKGSAAGCKLWGLQGARSHLAREGSSGGGARAVSKLLVVDDEPDVRALVARALQADYDVKEAESAIAATRLLKDGSFVPDLIISDVMMPQMDGFGFARILKAKPQFRHTAIIFLTARNSPMDVVQGINVGARHYIQKPFSIKDLLDKVKKTVGPR